MELMLWVEKRGSAEVDLVFARIIDMLSLPKRQGIRY